MQPLKRWRDVRVEHSPLLVGKRIVSIVNNLQCDSVRRSVFFNGSGFDKLPKVVVQLLVEVLDSHNGPSLNTHYVTT